MTPEEIELLRATHESYPPMLAALDEIERLREVIGEALPLLITEKEAIEPIYEDGEQVAGGDVESYCSLAHSVLLLNDALSGGAG